MKTYSHSQEPFWERRDPPPESFPTETASGGAGTAEAPDVTLADRGRALEGLPEGVLLIDRSRPGPPIVYANPALGGLTGYAPEELLGRPLTVLRGPDSDPAVFAEIQEAIRAGRAWSGEVLVSRRDGTPSWHELRLTPLPDGRGRTQYVLGVQSDITERKNLQEGLAQAQKMAAVGCLAGGIAHDFNNLLTAILGYCDMLLAEAPSISVREGLEEIKKAGLRGATLIRQLLALCRKQQAEPRVLDLRTLLADMKGLLHRLLQEHVELVTVIDPFLGHIRAAPGQVEQVLLNLVGNARDAMPQGGTITLELTNVYRVVGPNPAPGSLPPGSYVLLAVTDTGCGIREDVRAGLFQPLITTKDPGKGTGLGLFMVNEIVKQNRGFITVTSQPGQGTRVEIYWPRVEGTIPSDEPARAPAPPRRASETILLVEDEQGVRDLMSWVLRQQGYTVLEARDGREALAVGREHPGPIHLLLTDVCLPQMNGHQLAAQLAPVRPEMKVIYLSGSYPPENEGDVLAKPLTQETLTRTVRAVLDQRAPASSV